MLRALPTGLARQSAAAAHPFPAACAAASQRRRAPPRPTAAAAASTTPPHPTSTPAPVSVTSLAAVLQAASRAGQLGGGGEAISGSDRIHAAAAAAAPDAPSTAPPGHGHALPADGALPATVYLVGTGPGDPGLLTLAALQLMATASVVLVDRLVSPDVLALVNPGAEVVDVGKEAGLHTLAQPAIAAALITASRDQAARVAAAGDAAAAAAAAAGGGPILRLKGGDPFIFGRGGEEAAALRAAGVSVCVVPGVTAAAGVCASLGIPATHRGLATSVRYLTGHALEGGGAGLDDTVARAADPDTTLVVYMGLGTLPALASRLMGGDDAGAGAGAGAGAESSSSRRPWAGAGAMGLDPSTPAVAVERGTTPRQRAVFAPLGSLASAVGPEGAALASPTLIIIGKVVALAPGWVEARGEEAWVGVAAAAREAAAAAVGGAGEYVAL